MQQIKNQTTAKPTGRLLHFVETMLAANGSYLADRLYTFAHSKNSGFTLQPSPDAGKHKLRWLILGREHYFETSKEYPIANKRELQRALRFEDDQAPFKGINFQQIERINEQSHRVTFWVVKPQLLEDLPARPWLLLPESYLLAKALDDNIDIAAIERAGETLFVSKAGQTLASGLQSSYTPSLQHFAFSTGSPTNVGNSTHYPATTTNFAQLLRKGLKALSIAQLVGFVVKTDQQNWRNYPWKKAGVISVGAFALYLALSSGWLLYKQQQLEQQLTSQAAEVNQALAVQKKYQQLAQWQLQLASPLEDLQPYWHVWPVLLEALTTGARVSAVHFKADLITMHGETNAETEETPATKATEILSKLTDNPMVTSAKFASPVKAYRGRERFSISFAFAAPKNEPKVIEGAIDAAAK